MCVPLYCFERYAHTYASGVPKMVMTEKIFCCHVQLCQCRWCRQSLCNGFFAKLSALCTNVLQCSDYQCEK